MNEMYQINPIILTALIAALTSIITFFFTLFTKNYLEHKLLKSKLATEHLYSQQKSIKDVLSKFKTHMLESSELLNYRLLNFSKHYVKGWHNIGGNYDNFENYYFSSFIYRILRLLSWIRIVEKELIFLDTTIATKEDLEFVKFIKILKRVMQDQDLFSGFEYSDPVLKDHLFRDNIDEMSYVLIENNNVYTYSEFKEMAVSKLPHYKALCEFIDGMRQDEDRLRWDRLFCFHIMLICFINIYGYDFQKVTDLEVKTIGKCIKNPKIIDNLISLLIPYKINEHHEFKRIIKLIENH